MLYHRGLVFTNIFLALLSGVSATIPKDLYRGEKETPTEVQARGYLRCDALKNGVPYDTSVTLVRHVEEPRSSRPGDPWLSTTASREKGADFAILNSGWLYKIDSTVGGVTYRSVAEEFRSLNRQLGVGKDDQEYSARNTIPLEAIVSWAQVSMNAQFRVVIGTPTANPAYKGTCSITKRGLVRRGPCDGSARKNTGAASASSGSKSPASSGSRTPASSGSRSPASSGSQTPASSGSRSPASSGSRSPASSGSRTPASSGSRSPASSGSQTPASSGSRTPASGGSNSPSRASGSRGTGTGIRG
ncbi:uncharacterized protein PgNI_02237 [Pyricularia grisea]|uniref:Uncharacterized protein n=1 Tax=Pyricularia grisea TaxID=148305 RepID=A0A6P8BKK8_PYRGI|nr:uncharacterized protein PgNI_02237 [Pyricularia grisea]TLD17328.1 hypothetical protein PgNI_02237 [Pyricularia grisea]